MHTLEIIWKVSFYIFSSKEKIYKKQSVHNLIYLLRISACMSIQCLGSRLASLFQRDILPLTSSLLTTTRSSPRIGLRKRTKSKRTSTDISSSSVTGIWAHSLSALLLLRSVSKSLYQCNRVCVPLISDGSWLVCLGEPAACRLCSAGCRETTQMSTNARCHQTIFCHKKMISLKIFLGGIAWYEIKEGCCDCDSLRAGWRLLLKILETQFDAQLYCRRQETDQINISGFKGSVLQIHLSKIEAAVFKWMSLAKYQT